MLLNKCNTQNPYIKIYYFSITLNITTMAVLQSFDHLLSVNGMAAGSVDPNFPGVQPTAQSPCPIWVGSNKHVMGISPATASQIAAFPAALTCIYYDYSNGNQRFTGTALVSQVTATVVTNWA